ncbi:MAG: hypothetical protein LDL33_08005 [Desulfomonile sp.]|nr:hypothetical protein [Desulfomonile sp.]
MLIREKGIFVKGMLLLITFLVVLAAMFLPLFEGKNALEASDDLFNSISKGSTYFVPDLLKKSEAFKANTIDVALKFKEKDDADKAVKILTTAGMQAGAEGDQVKTKGNFGQMLAATLKDSEAMFKNQDAEISSRYGMSPKEATYTWWLIAKEMDKDLKRQKLFKEAAFLNDVVRKGVEVGYNFHKITPQTASTRVGVLTFSLVFYVIYTLWWGIAVLWLFEGMGLEMKAGAKKEV